MIDIANGMTLDEARALKSRVQAEHPAWRDVGLYLHDACGSFVVNAWTPFPAQFWSVAEYEQMEARHA